MDPSILQEMRSSFFKGIEMYPLNLFKEQYKNNTLNGIFIFVISDCIYCERHVKTFPMKNKHIVDCYEDWNFYRFDLGLDDMPTTRVYVDGKVIYESCGIMYDTQINAMKQAIIDY